jgi:1-acyl-sn-glycerol-3-phosphate acyltransferase
MLRTLGAGLRTFLAAPVFIIYTIIESAVARWILRTDKENALERTERLAQRWTRRFMSIPPISLSVEGLDNVEPGEQYIVVSNHLSNFDIPVTVRAMPFRTRFIAKHEIGKVPLFGKAAEGVGVVMIDRDSVRSNHEALNQAIKQSLDDGNSILVFAEGTRSRTGEMQEFRRGAARIALATGMDILPIVVHGTFEVNPPGSPVVYPGEVTVRILPPISIDGYTAQDVRALTDEVRSTILQNFEEMAAAKQHQS